MLLAPDRAVERRVAAIVAETHANDIRAGRSVALDSNAAGAGTQQPAICRAYDAEGQFLAILRAAGDGLWRPSKVFPAPAFGG
jgi:hypothetical protein